MKKLHVVISVYNEEGSLRPFYEEITEVLKDAPWDYCLCFVNDGSIDQSLEILKDFNKRDRRVKVLNLSRNFGHEAAMIAGIDHSGDADVVVCMDADLQHPPIKLLEIMETFDKGCDVIRMVRDHNEDQSFFGRLASSTFYRLMNKLSSKDEFSPNASDFFAMSRRVAEILKVHYRERVRFLRGYVQNLGFKQTTLNFDAGHRVAGESKYPFRKLLRLSFNALCSFSDAPLRIGTLSGGVVGLLGLIIMIYSIIQRFVNQVPAGYSTIIVVLCFMFSITLFVIGIIGEYLAVIFNEMKERPIYLVEEVLEHDNKTKESL